MAQRLWLGETHGEGRSWRERHGDRPLLSCTGAHCPRVAFAVCHLSCSRHLGHRQMDGMGRGNK